MLHLTNPEESNESLASNTANLPSSQEKFAVCATSAQALVVENLIALHDREGDRSELPINDYLELINKITLSAGEKTGIDYKKHILTVGKSQQEGSAISVANILVHTVLCLHAAEKSNTSIRSEDLRKLFSDCSGPARELTKKLSGRDGSAYGLAKDVEREQFDEMIQEILEPTDEDLQKRNIIAKELANAHQLPETATKVVAEFSFLGKLMHRQRQRLSDQEFSKDLWQAFGPRLDAIFQIPDRESRAESLKAALRSICNSIAKEYLLGRNNISRGSLQLQANENQLEFIANLNSDTLRCYLLSRGNHGRDITGLQSQIINAAKKLDTTVDLFAFLHSSEKLLSTLRTSISSFDLTEAARAQWNSRGVSLLGSTLSQATLLIAATPKGEDLIIPSSTGQLRIGHSAITNLVGEESNLTGVGKSKHLAPQLNPYFIPENGYPSRLEISDALISRINQVKTIESFSDSLPPIMQAAFNRVAVLSGQPGRNQPGLDQWISNIHALYLESVNDNSKRSKTLLGIWEQKTSQLPQFSKRSIEDINDTLATSHGDATTTITKDQLLTAYFLTSVLVAYIRGAEEQKSAEKSIIDAIEKLHKEQHSFIYLLVRTELALRLSSLETPAPVASKYSPEPATKPTTSSSSLLSGLFRKTTPAPQQEEKQVATIHSGESFQDLRIRVMQNGTQLIETFETLNLLEQQSQLRLLVAGEDRISIFEKVLRNSSRNTHPDTRSHFFPQQEIHPSLDLIYKAILGIDELVKADAEYEKNKAELMLSQLVKGMSELDTIEERFKIQEERNSKDTQRVALEVIPEIAATLKQLVLEVQGLRADIAELKNTPQKSSQPPSDRSN